MQKREIYLKPPEREQLIQLVSQGYPLANEFKRASRRLHRDRGLTDEVIGQRLFCSEARVRRTHLRYLHEGHAAAREDPPPAGREPSWNPPPAAYRIALACSNPPAGHEHWTLELLAPRLVEAAPVVEISTETVRWTLKNLRGAQTQRTTASRGV